MIVNLTKKNAGIITIPCQAKDPNGKMINTGTLILTGGNQYVPDEKWTQAEKACAGHIEKGYITTIKADREVKGKDGKKVKPATDKPANDITDMSLKSAEKLIKETFSVDTLTKWLDIEERESIALLMRKQIEIVNPAKK